MRLEIVTPDRQIFSGEVRLIRLPGSDGTFAVLENHAPIISTLEDGDLKIIHPTGEETFFTIQGGGVVEVNQNKAIVLVERIIAV